MDQNLEVINESVNEIREILGAECATIDELPAMVRALSESASKGGFTTAFIFSVNSNPNRPTGGSFNATTGSVEGVVG
jgi:hypothetical protein